MMSVFLHIRRLSVALIVVLLMACGLEATAQIIKHEGKAYDPHTYAAEIHLMSTVKSPMSRKTIRFAFMLLLFLKRMMPGGHNNEN